MLIRERIPATSCNDPWREPALPIQGPDQLVDVDDVRLQFDHEEGASTWMPRDDVDDAPFRVDREGHLRRKDPVRELSWEPADDQLMERRML